MIESKQEKRKEGRPKNSKNPAVSDIYLGPNVYMCVVVTEKVLPHERDPGRVEYMKGCYDRWDAIIDGNGWGERGMSLI